MELKRIHIFIALLFSVFVGFNSANGQTVIDASIQLKKGYTALSNQEGFDAYNHFNKAVELYEFFGNEDSAILALKYMRSAMLSLEKQGYDETAVSNGWDTTKAFFGIKEIISDSEDSVVIKLKGGSIHGVFVGSTGGFLSGPSDSLEERENKVVGYAEVIACGTVTSTVLLTYSTGMKEYGVRLEDLVSIKVERSKNRESTVFGRLMDDAISFQNLWDEYPYYSIVGFKEYHAIPVDLILQTMVDEMHDFGSAIADMDAYKEMRIDGGKYNGELLYDASQKVTVFDVKMFLHYAANYPFNYMAQDINFSLGMGAWLKAGSPVMDKGEVFKLVYSELLALPFDEAAIKASSANYMEYVYDAFGEGSELNTLFDKPFRQGKENEVDSLIQKLIWLSEETVYDSIYGNILWFKAYIHSVKKEYATTIDVYTKILERELFVHNTLWARGNVYFELEEYSKAIADYDSIIPYVNDYWASQATGNKGAALFRLGEWKKAKPLFREAYVSDTAESTWNVNMGIAQLFSNHQDSADYFFDRFLDHINSRAEFDGMIEAFEFNIEKGWYVELSQQYKVKMQQKWEEDYSMNVLSLESYNLSQEAIERDDRKQAILHLDTAVWAELQKKEINYSDLRAYYRWKGFTYYNMGSYDSSVVYYTKAMEVNVAHIQNQEILVDDYDDVGNVYAWLDNSVNERIYDQLEYGLSYKLKMDTFRPKLFYLGISNVRDANHYRSSDRDVTLLHDALTSSRNLAFSEKQLIHINGGTKESVQEGFRQAAQEIAEDDVFFLHIACPTYKKGNRKGIVIGDDSLDLQSLFANMAFVNAGQTICVVDVEDVDFAEEYMGHQSRMQTDKENTENVFIVAPAEVRKESAEGSEFITPIISLFRNEEQVDGLDVVAHLQKEYAKNGSGLSVSTYISGRPPIFVKTSIEEQAVISPIKVSARAVVVEDIGNASNSKSEALFAGVARDYALLFAINDYDNLSTLSNPINDAYALAKVLKELYGFEVEVVENPTQMEIRAKISEYQNKIYGPKDQLLIYFAGHGFYDESKGFSYLACKNSIASQEEAENNYPSFLQYSYFHSNIGYMKSCKNVFMIMDVCFGGTFFDNTNASATYASIEKDEVSQLIDNKRQIPTRLFLTSGGNEYVPDGTPGANSPFSLKLIQALEQRAAGTTGTAKDFVTLEDIVKYMHVLPTKVRYGSFGLYQQNGDFIFEYKADDGIESLRQNRANQ